MQAYEPSFLSGHSTPMRLLRGAAAVVVVALTGAAWVTAGPGNYDQAPRLRVSLEPVTVVGHRDVAAMPGDGAVLAGGCERPQDGRTLRKVG